jgi:hypothetical protein
MEKNHFMTKVEMGEISVSALDGRSGLPFKIQWCEDREEISTSQPNQSMITDHIAVQARVIGAVISSTASTSQLKRHGHAPIGLLVFFFAARNFLLDKNVP